MMSSSFSLENTGYILYYIRYIMPSAAKGAVLIINFLIVAFVLFVTIKAINMLHKKPVEEPKEPTTKKCPYCQSEIAIKAVRCPHCTSKLEGFPEAKL